MLNMLVKFINKLMFFLNTIVLVLLLVWAIAGIWEFMPMANLLYWKVTATLIAILLFNILTLFCLSYLYKRTARMVDIFSGSDAVKKYQEGAVIFDEGQVQKIMYVLIKGQVKISTDGEILNVINEGEIFGEMAIIEDLPRTASAICLTDCQLVAINEKRFYQLVHEIPFFAKEVMRTMSRRLRELDHHH